MHEQRCTLQYAAGRIESCPGSACPFWLAEGEGGTCVFTDSEHIIETNSRLAQHLLELRLALQRPQPEGTEARSLFYRLLNEEQEAEGVGLGF